MEDFDYLKKDDAYLDSACQSLRPRPVIDAVNRYYTEHNSCGERVKYVWGRETDDIVEETREQLLKYLKLKQRDYVVSFTLNTTYGINLLLSQFKPKLFRKVMTSDIEHNSPFLSTMAFAKKNGIKREIITREEDGSIDISRYSFEKSLVVVNCVSNIDGRKLTNIKELVKKVHSQNGVIIVDAAQALAHNSELLYKTEADAICSSAHKMYGPSLGIMIVRRDLFDKIDTSFIGGGMVDDVDRDSYKLSADSENHAYTKFEAGLQSWGEIVGLHAALKWLNHISKKDKKIFKQNYDRLYEYLKNNEKICLVNNESSPTLSFYIKGIDSHLAGGALSSRGIMARTGYFCVHYYLDHVKNYPPLIRFSLGYHVRPSDIDKTIETLERMTK